MAINTFDFSTKFKEETESELGIKGLVVSPFIDPDDRKPFKEGYRDLGKNGHNYLIIRVFNDNGPVNVDDFYFTVQSKDSFDYRISKSEKQWKISLDDNYTESTRRSGFFDWLRSIFCSIFRKKESAKSRTAAAVQGTRSARETKNTNVTIGDDGTGG